MQHRWLLLYPTTAFCSGEFPTGGCHSTATSATTANCMHDVGTEEKIHQESYLYLKYYLTFFNLVYFLLNLNLLYGTDSTAQHSSIFFLHVAWEKDGDDREQGTDIRFVLLTSCLFARLPYEAVCYLPDWDYRSRFTSRSQGFHLAFCQLCCQCYGFVCLLFKVAIILHITPKQTWPISLSASLLTEPGSRLPVPGYWLKNSFR